MAKRYKDKNFFSFFVLLGLAFLTLVIANWYLDEQTSGRAKAGGSTCWIELPNKYMVVSKDKRGNVIRRAKTNRGVIYDADEKQEYFAVEKGKEIGFKVFCTGLDSDPVGYWNFGDDNCRRWQRTAKSIGSGRTQIVYENRHTFRQNGDYWMGFWVKDGDNNYFPKIKVGVYSKKSYGKSISQSVPDGDDTPDVNIIDDMTALRLTGVADARLAGYTERMCLFSREEETRGLAYREVIPTSDRESFVDSRFYFGDINAGSKSNFCNADMFWDFAGKPIWGQVNKLKYVLKGVKGEEVGPTLDVDRIEVIYRRASEYKEGQVCLPKGI